MHQLRGHVVWRLLQRSVTSQGKQEWTYADVGVGKAGLGERLRKAKVTQFDEVVLVEENCPDQNKHEPKSSQSVCTRTIVWFQVSMENLWPPLPPVIRPSTTASATVPVRVVTVVQGEENLHEVVPDGIFRDWPVLALGLLDDGGEVATSAVLHEDVEDACVAVDVAVVIAYDVFMVEVLENVTIEGDDKA